jgi:hypothetical protein
MTSFCEINGQRVREVYDEKLGFSRLYTDTDDELLVLIAPNFGAGWSTWNGGDDSEKLLADSRIIRFYHDTYLKTKTREVGPFQEFLESLGIYNVYITTLRPLKDYLKIHQIPKGSRFRVDEYDGSETIVYFQEESWATA